MARSPATDSAALVNAAAAVFKSKGYRNATIDDIADAAGPPAVKLRRLIAIHV